MIAWVSRRPLTTLLAVLAAVLVVVIALESGLGASFAPSGATATKPAAPAEAKLLPPVLAQSPEQAYPEMAARPLFTPTRRPAPAEPNAGKPAFARGQFILQGVIAVGDQRTALLKEKTSGKVHRVDRGKEFNGITVEAVEPTEVTLSMNGERERVALVVQRPDGPGRVAANAPASGADQAGPFTPQAAAPAAVTQAPAAAGVDPAQGAAVANNPANRAAAAAAAAAARAPATANAPSPTTQPMTPEELLARRRARRNQPTQ